MADMQALKSAVDELSPQELDELYRHLEARRRQLWWVVPEENIARLDTALKPLHAEAATMTDVEIDESIDAAIAEVRRERKAKSDL